MELVRVTEDNWYIPDRAKNACVALGNFDGMHKGHQYIVDCVVQEANKLSTSSCIITFEPHPEVFLHDRKRFLVGDLNSKRILATCLNVDFLIALFFSESLASMTAERFVDDILIKLLSVQAIFVGKDFHFGKNRAGSVKYLEEIREFTTYVVDSQYDSDGYEYRSTGVRKALSSARMEDVRSYLGYWYKINGIVSRGDARGRSIGFPTANLLIENEAMITPPIGVYAVLVNITSGPMSGTLCKGVANLGSRPTFCNNGTLILEVHLINFSEDIYGESISVSLCHYLRAESKFASVSDLVSQITCDIDQAHNVLRDIEHDFVINNL